MSAEANPTSIGEGLNYLTEITLHLFSISSSLNSVAGRVCGYEPEVGSLPPNTKPEDNLRSILLHNNTELTRVLTIIERDLNRIKEAL